MGCYQTAYSLIQIWISLVFFILRPLSVYNIPLKSSLEKVLQINPFKNIYLEGCFFFLSDFMSFPQILRWKSSLPWKITFTVAKLTCLNPAMGEKRESLEKRLLPGEASYTFRIKIAFRSIFSADALTWTSRHKTGEDGRFLHIDQRTRWKA